MPKNSAITPKIKKQILALRAEKKTIPQIEKIVNLSQSSISRVVEEAKSKNLIISKNEVFDTYVDLKKINSDYDIAIAYENLTKQIKGKQKAPKFVDLIKFVKANKS